MQMADIEYLEEERKKLWERVTTLSQQVAQLQEDIHKTTPECEQEARNASKEISKYKNRASNAWQEIEKIKGEIQDLIKESQVILQAKSTAITINQSLTDAQTILTESKEAQLTLDKTIQSINNQSAQIQAMQEDVTNKFSTAQSSSNKIASLLETAVETKDKINDIYDEIDGYDTLEGKHVEGLKEKLEKKYTQLEKDSSFLKSNIETIENNLLSWKENFIKEKTEEFNTLSEQIKSLLPGAMSAGLSAAYGEQKRAETNERNSTKHWFIGIIIAMVVLALIPVCLYIYLYCKGNGIDYIIQHTPQITISIVPLYLPLIWLAAHLNKHINLSKKLMEEYAYKEALNKTYEGLAGQIKELSDEDNELRKEHLKIILKASAENPGKFITGYDKCDNPILELLSKPKELNNLLKDNPILATVIKQTQTINKETEINDK